MLSPSQTAGDRVRAELAALIDLQMSPLGLVAIDALAPRAGEAILDIGCGAGQTIVQLLDRVGPAGRVIGVDIAPQVLAVARARTARLPQVTLLQADAGTLAMPDTIVDGVFSRFGTMFFADPVAAFSNLHRLLRRGGRLAFVCWRTLAENELDFVPVEAAGLAGLVDPAPFSFDTPDTIRRGLDAAGFGNIAITPHDAQVSSGDTQAMLTVVTRVGALGKILRDHPARLATAEPLVRSALATRERDGVVRLGAATWIVTATAGQAPGS